MAKSNRRAVQDRRQEKKEQRGERVIKEKHTARNADIIAQRPLVPLTDLQGDYINYCRSKPVILAVGFPGTSKTYIPTRIAIEKLLLEEVKRIVVVRPAVSDSKSMGFFAGDKVAKCKNWIMPVLDTLNEYLGSSRVDYLIENDVILPLPLETIKGMSLKDSFIIVDEAEDITVKEFVKCVTRIGSNSTMVFAGDIMQVDIRQNSGLATAMEMATEDSTLDWGVINFDRPDDIVRSEASKKATLALRRKGLI